MQVQVQVLPLLFLLELVLTSDCHGCRLGCRSKLWRRSL